MRAIENVITVVGFCVITNLYGKSVKTSREWSTVIASSAKIVIERG